MLDKEQIAKLATLINKDVDIPFLPESMEQVIIEDTLTIFCEAVESILPPSFRRFLKSAKDSEPLRIQGIGRLWNGLVAQLFGTIKIPWISEETKRFIAQYVVTFLLTIMCDEKSDDELVNNTGLMNDGTMKNMIRRFEEGNYDNV